MNTLEKKIVLPLVNLILFIATLVVNTLANTIPINGKNTGEISDLYPNFFVPSGFTFSIWGVIYLLLGIFTFFQLRAWYQPDKENHEIHEQIHWLFAISCFANISWILSWHYLQVGIALVNMLALLAALLSIYLRLDIGRRPVSRQVRYLVHLPFSVYLGWISVATIANVTAFLVYRGYEGGAIGEINWAVTMISVGTVLALLMLFRRKDWAYALVILWAYFGILYKQSRVVGVENQSLITALYVAFFVLVSIMVYLFFIRKK